MHCCDRTNNQSTTRGPEVGSGGESPRHYIICDQSPPHRPSRGGSGGNIACALSRDHKHCAVWIKNTAERRGSYPTPLSILRGRHTHAYHMRPVCPQNLKGGGRRVRHPHNLDFGIGDVCRGCVSFVPGSPTRQNFKKTILQFSNGHLSGQNPVPPGYVHLHTSPPDAPTPSAGVHIIPLITRLLRDGSSALSGSGS